MKTKRILSLLLVLILCLSLAPAALAEDSGLFDVQLSCRYDQTGARSMLDMVNTLRREDARQLDESENWVDLGELHELRYSDALEEIAMQRAVEIALSFDHTRPNGESCFTCLASDGTRSYGENIAAGYATVQAAFVGWCEEDEPYAYQGHRRNMLKDGFQSIGIAHVIVNGTHYWVQEFSWYALPDTGAAPLNGEEVRSIPVAASSLVETGAAAAEPSSLSLQVGETAAFPKASAALRLVEAWPDRSTAVETQPAWQSGDESVVSCANGSVTALGAGETTLTATVFNGQSLSVPVTVQPSQPALADGFYLIRPDWTVDAIDPAQRFEANPAAQGEYLLTTDLSAGEQLKVVKVVNGGSNAWYPDGLGNEYTVDGAHAGHVTVYFRDAYHPDWASFGGYIYIGAALSPVQSAQILGVSLSLEGFIGLNCYVEIPQSLLDDPQAYVLLDGKTLLVADAPTRTVNGCQARSFSALVTAKEMRRRLTMQLFDGQGNAVPLQVQDGSSDESFHFSVQDYLDKTLASDASPKLLAVVTAMNDYGSCAQVQFHYDTDNRSPLLGNPEAVSPEELSSFTPSVEQAEDGGLRYAGATLQLEAGTTFRFYFRLQSGTIGDYRICIDGTEASPVKNGSYWTVEVDNLSAKDLDRTVSVTVDAGGERVITLSCSPLSYAWAVLSGNTGTAELKLLCQALFRYWQAAEAYFA